MKFGRLGFNHPAVALPVEIGFFLCPGQVIVGFADQFLGGLNPRGPSEVAITAEVGGIAVFPEDVLGDVVKDQLQHLLRLP